MKIEQLRMLKTVAELGTLKTASETLFKTQAAVSKGIKQLESQLGIELFNREGYRMSLTIQGQQIYQLALMLLEKAQEIEDLSQHLNAGNEAVITLAVNSTFDLTIILPALEKMQNEYPDTQVIIRQEQITGAVEALDKEQADLAISIVINETITNQKYDLLNIHQGSVFSVAAPKLLNRHQNLTKARQLEKEYQIVIQDSGNQSKGQSFGVQTGQRCWYVNDFATKKMLILSGMGWGGLPKHLIEQELDSGQLIQLELVDSKNAQHLNYCLLKNKNKLLGPVASLLWQSLQEISEATDD
ncbi:MAG: LysR family transcriptional regulator [Colwellia sp.]|nr:LysR family transcriptional regulator [Colwellia sp.]